MSIRCAIVAASAAGLFASGALAVIVPFTETFDGPAANWSSGVTFTPLNYPASGGPDGSAYGSTTFNFGSSVVGDIPLLFRGQSNFNSSNGGLAGNWLAAGATHLTFQVRHNAAAPVDFFARFSPTPGTPGTLAAVADFFDPVAPNQWTTLTVPLSAATPFIYEGPPLPGNFTTAFSNVTRVQIGLTVDAALAGSTVPVVFDIDNVALIPAPGAGALLGLVLAGMARRRR